MQIRWTLSAAEDLDQIAAYIARDSVAVAERIINEIIDAAESLVHHPLRARAGKIQGTRELVLTPLPYLVIYRGNCHHSERRSWRAPLATNLTRRRTHLHFPFLQFLRRFRPVFAQQSR